MFNLILVLFCYLFLVFESAFVISLHFSFHRFARQRFTSLWRFVTYPLLYIASRRLIKVLLRILKLVKKYLTNVGIKKITYISGADLGEGPGGPNPTPPRYFETKLRPEGPKKFFWRQALPRPPYLRSWMTAAPPPPFPLSEGLGPPLYIPSCEKREFKYLTRFCSHTTSLKDEDLCEGFSSGGHLELSFIKLYSSSEIRKL